MLLKSDKSDSLSIHFRLCYQIEDICDFMFDVNVKVGTFTHEAKEVWITNDALQRFISGLDKLYGSLKGKAELDSINHKFHLSIESYGKHGYLLARTIVHYPSPQYFQLHSTENTFNGGFLVEPARLPEWIDELTRVTTEKEPSTDFLGNWNTSLPLPERLRNKKAVQKGG